MLKCWAIIFAGGMAASGCGDAPLKTAVQLPTVDTTITPQNAFTRLTLDSTRLAVFIRNEVADDTVAAKMARFYRRRAYQYAWFTEEGLSEAAQGFWAAHQERETNSDSNARNTDLHRQMAALLTEDSAALSPADWLQTELRLTRYFLKYVRAALTPSTDPENFGWHIPRRKLQPLALLDTLLAKGQWKPLSKSYDRLSAAVQRLAAVSERDSGSKVVFKKGLHAGVNDASITGLKQRLHLFGYFKSRDTSALFTKELKEGVQRACRAFGLKETSVPNAGLIKALNVPLNERVRQALVNLERMRWMPTEAPDRLVANIPEYRLHVYQGGKETLTMRIVVGKAANRTVIFSDSLKHIVFSPYWNVPRSIVRKELAPAMRRSSRYLQRNRMEITGYSGGLPVIRQKPGAGNALGKVKFLFPNSYNIYFHDTPAKSLFEREQRAFSHGCIRLQQPAALAKLLLGYNPQWTDDAINKAMNRSAEKWVTLPQPLPVFIVYFTAWTDEDGLLNFRDDIYGHDERLRNHLFEQINRNA